MMCQKASLDAVRHGAILSNVMGDEKAPWINSGQRNYCINSCPERSEEILLGCIYPRQATQSLQPRTTSKPQRKF